jgi:hypothetical protein
VERLECVCVCVCVFFVMERMTYRKKRSTKVVIDRPRGNKSAKTGENNQGWLFGRSPTWG